eukprot:scaffold28633_cov61-Phaeocystis_antarctica.AAC.4
MSACMPSSLGESRLTPSRLPARLSTRWSGLGLRVRVRVSGQWSGSVVRVRARGYRAYNASPARRGARGPRSYGCGCSAGRARRAWAAPLGPRSYSADSCRA